MLYDTRDYWVFELCPLPGVQEEHNFAETGVLLSLGDELETLLGPLEKPKLWVVP
jgi:hypothetical protein